MDMFRTPPAAPVTAAAPTTNSAPVPGNIPAPQQASSPTNPNAPVTTGTDGTNKTATESVNPLDAFKDLWQPPKTVEGQTPKANMFDVNPEKLMEAAGKVDFARVIKPEHLEAISKGGPEGVAAFAAAMNSVSQTVYAQSALATTKIVEQALKQQKESFDTELPGILKKHGLGNSLRTKNPALNHDAVTPLTSALVNQLSTKFPAATEAELTEMAETYLTSAFEAIAPKKVPEDTGKGTGKDTEPDWAELFGISKNVA